MFDEIRARFFPFEIVPDITARPIPTRRELFAIAGKYFDEVFTPFSELGAYELPAERHDEKSRLREAFSRTHQEHFVFYEGENVVGWSYGEMVDAETYFMTNSAILSDYRQRGLYSKFLPQLIAYLTTLGYERITSTHQMNNRAVLIAKMKAGFVMSGVVLDERWSAQVQLTYHVHEDRRRGFERAFSLELT